MKGWQNYETIWDGRKEEEMGIDGENVHILCIEEDPTVLRGDSKLCEALKRL